MFRAQGNIFDEVVVKATDENLTSENWEYILVCHSCLPGLRALPPLSSARDVLGVAT